MFTKKKEFLAKCFNQLPLLAEYKEDGLRMLGEAFDTSLKKNNFTHGTLDSMVAENGVFHFHRLQHAETNFAVETFEFNPRAEWPILEKSLLALLRDSSQLSASLRNRFLTKPK